MSVSVVYWSGTGNTQAMAEAVAEGIKETGADANLIEVGNADAAALASEDAFALGCPSMGAEQLEESEMEPFVEELEPLVSGKKILLFGSYGWGDGEWMRDWADRMKNAGAVLVREEGVSVLFSTHITSDLMRIADDIVYISRGKILAACPLNELLEKYKVAHFSSLADATAVNAIGVKSVKGGYEGLLPRDTQGLNNFTLADATIDNIIVHLEKANEEKRYG